MKELKYLGSNLFLMLFQHSVRINPYPCPLRLSHFFFNWWFRCDGILQTLTPSNSTLMLRKLLMGIGAPCAVVRDASGFFIAAAYWSFQGLADASVAKATTVHQGLLFVRNCCLDKVAMETNFISLVLCSKQSGPNWSYLGQVVRERRL